MRRFFTPSWRRFLGVVVLHGALVAGARFIAWFETVAPPEVAVPIAVKFSSGQLPSAASPPALIRHAEPPPPVLELPPPPTLVPPLPAPPDPPRTTTGTSDHRARKPPAAIEQAAKSARPQRKDAAKNARSDRPITDSTGEAGRGDSPPVLVASSVPTYPVAARMANIEGSVQVRATVDSRGRVDGTRLSRSSGHPDLDAAALNAVRHWRFKPATRQGRPIAADTLVRVRFALR